jgi:macrolide transport system ATP-binding/permease protein
VRRVKSRLSHLFGRFGRDRELGDELDTHIELHIVDNCRAGMTPEAARREPLMKLGGLDVTKERCRVLQWGGDDGQ